MGRPSPERVRESVQRWPALHRHTKEYEFACHGLATDSFGADDVAARLSR